ncbi:related to ER membrane DUF1077 domain protein [Rhynchosporium agropyri]|uniref:ER membrane protein complex subunit 4 n=1 Tax=Rhynchosporium agropyri TaxID=914238 RepID=A0A1E1JSG5_9HELO|nr:related to ER membrane DUF1077 domain protein [Rhynchosporium agropyri]
MPACCCYPSTIDQRGSILVSGLGWDKEKLSHAPASLVAIRSSREFESSAEAAEDVVPVIELSRKLSCSSKVFSSVFEEWLKLRKSEFSRGGMFWHEPVSQLQNQPQNLTYPALSAKIKSTLHFAHHSRKLIVDLREGEIKMAAPPPPPQWKQQLSSSKASTIRAAPTTEEMDILKLKKAWEVALAPVKQLPMTAIMMYMSGNTLQIFTIMTVIMAFKNPFMGLLATNQAFERFESPGTKAQLLMVKAVYVAMQILALALGVWKVNGMGLLPTTRSDWLAWETRRVPMETALPAF